MNKTEAITDVPDEQLNFVLELLKFQGASMSVVKVGTTWSAKATFPDPQTARAAHALLPAFLMSSNDSARVRYSSS